MGRRRGPHTFRGHDKLAAEPFWPLLSERGRALLVRLCEVAAASVQHTRGDSEVGCLLAGEGRPMSLQQLKRGLGLRQAGFVRFCRELEHVCPGRLVCWREGSAPDLYTLACFGEWQYGRASAWPHANAERQRRWRGHRQPRIR